jgi:hypothetical protein
MVLTEKGKTTTEPTDFGPIQGRGLLREEMLHPPGCKDKFTGILRLTT